MRVFVSSLITGMEAVRAAAREAVTTLRYEAIMAEDFGASPRSPQVACLTELRRSDLVALILGENHGAVQPSGSLLPMKSTARREAESRSSRSGRCSPRYATARFCKGDPGLGRRRTRSTGAASLNLSVAGAPRQAILRPIELEKPSLADALHQAALFGPNVLFDKSLRVEREIENETLTLSQERNQAAVSVNEQGSVVISLPARDTNRRMAELIQEHAHTQLSTASAYASWLLDEIDPTQRTTHVAIAASILNAEHMGWRTQREGDENPNHMSLESAAGMPRKPVHVVRTRPSMRLDAAHIIEDLIVPLRRQWN